ncbi:hypothetical protein BFP76_11845 [Amylibacter kogurei]|uniref:VOC domain-containing protein n=1 Tax=Paramylibacter kogurei TaxID=1889778 RepID=A0A2G5KAM7_9RHOB|nr:VOC family protein [Amylibacter kogurei]PIB26581.1 hypothetical protein BFP76_11845 [Amylibacter kogurei]
MPILSVKDVLKSADFFAAMGFEIAGHWNNDDGSVNFAIVHLDTVTVGLMRDLDARGSGENWVSYFYLNDINAFADHIQGNGIELAREIVDQVYGCRDLEVIDLDGNRMCFGQDLTPGSAGPGL